MRKRAKASTLLEEPPGKDGGSSPWAIRAAITSMALGIADRLFPRLAIAHRPRKFEGLRDPSDHTAAGNGRLLVRNTLVGGEQTS